MFSPCFTVFSDCVQSLMKHGSHLGRSEFRQRDVACGHLLSKVIVITCFIILISAFVKGLQLHAAVDKLRVDIDNHLS